MDVQSAKLKVDGEPIFPKRRVILCGQREDVLTAIEKMERDGITTGVPFSAWATLANPKQCSSDRSRTMQAILECD
ncbi:unnamed protein product [Echinostoma caproni]|uniref:NET domain-containing protein n=1 Tax=Echinostoma caproni TaxID=27848 RepID=A0A183AF51_9TREM|nr:unnamed protein product [Echinostoma caproni]